MIRGKPVKLTTEQKLKVKQLCEEKLAAGDPIRSIDITREVFQNPKLDARCYEGKAVKAEMINLKIDFVTTQAPPHVITSLTDEQKLLIDNNVNDVPSVFELAKLVFNDNSIEPNDHRVILVKAYVDSIPQDVIQEYKDTTSDPKNLKYKAPKSVSTSMFKVNRFCNLNLKEDKLKDEERRCLLRLIKYLNFYRFVSTIEVYERESDREMFESQFIFLTWDKPDLVPEELNLYVNLCTDFVQQVSVQRQLALLGKLFEEKANDPEGAQLSMSLAENISTKTKELNDCKNRQKQLINDLIGKRSDRIETQTAANRSFLHVVQTFMVERERIRMIEVVKRERMLLSDEIDRLETMEEHHARIIGLGKREALN